MTAQLLCVMGLFVCGGDPVFQAGPPAQVQNTVQVSPMGQPGYPMVAWAAPAPAAAGGTAVVPAGYGYDVAVNQASAPMPPQTPALMSAEMPAEMPAPTPAVQPEGVQYFNLEELKTEMKSLAWTKGDYTITPYGYLWANLVEEAGRTYPGNYPLYVSKPRPNTNDDCYVNARSTRLGFDVLGPRIDCLDGAQSGGKVEIDFQRQIDVDYKPSLLLRHVYAEVKNDDFRLLVGQTWDVISPLTPGVLFYSVGWDGGNIGYRRPQFRAERYLALSDTFQVITQGSVDTCQSSDTTGSATTYTALNSGWPILEGRVAMRVGPRGPGCLPWEWGVSGHIGEFVYDFVQGSVFHFPSVDGVPVRTWSFNTDLRVPITSRFGVQGELFMGQALGPFFGGVGQTVNVTPYTDSHSVIHYASGDAIRSRGGWVNLWYDWTPRLHSHTGYSIDDPIDGDVNSGRVYNAFYFANVSFDVTPKLLVGFEYTSWRTLWAGPTVDATSQNFNFVVKYGF